MSGNAVAIERHVVERFARIAAAQPAGLAISDPDTALTYAELDDISARVARALVARGVGPGARVGMYFGRETNALIALLGVLKSGATAVPLLASQPTERLQQIAHDADLRVLLTNGAETEAVRFGVPMLTVAAAMAHSADAVLPTIDADSLATILYTSGTGGQPKGVPRSHRLLWQAYVRMQRILQCGPDDRLTFFSTVAMGQGLQGAMLAFLSGATLYPFDIRREGLTRLTGWMDDRRLTVWISSATLFRNLIRTLGPGRQFPDLRIVRIGGERVLPSDIDASRRVFPAARMLVSYAATETGAITIHEVEPGETYGNGVVPIGRPLDGMTVRILDEDGADVPTGAEGEIAAGCEGEHLFRTGDLGRQRDDGRIEHLGRKDLRVKIRGFRVEIEEIETVLTQQPDIVRAAVAAIPGPDGDPRLVAYVQMLPESDMTVELLRAELGIRLPEHAIPSAFVFLDEIPLSDSGKIARQRLPEPPIARPTLAANFVGPRNSREEAIAAVWREILGLETIGIHDGFLAVGGDSLKATLVASRLASRIGMTVPLAMLFEASTIAELSTAIDRIERTTQGDDRRAGLREYPSRANPTDDDG